MLDYSSLENPATRTGRTHRRNHIKEIAAFEDMTLEEIGAYMKLSHMMFQDGEPRFQADQAAGLVRRLGVDTDQGVRLVQRLMDLDLIVDLQGMLVSRAQILNFKKNAV